MYCKISNFLKVVAVLLAVVAALGFVSTLFRVPGSGTHQGSLQQPSDQPGEPEQPSDPEPVSMRLAYASEAKSGYLSPKESLISKSENTVICDQIVGSDSYIAYYASEIYESLYFSENEGFVLDLTFSPGDMDYIPSCTLECKVKAYGRTLWLLSPSIVQNEAAGEPYYVVYLLSDEQISIPKTGDTRLTYVVYPAKLNDTTIGIYYETYVDGSLIDQRLWSAEGEPSLGISFENFRFTFKECSEASSIRLSDFSVSVFGDIDTSGCYEGSVLVNEPTSLNDAFIQEFVKDRSVLQKIES